MKDFAHLIDQLSASTKTNDKVKALVTYFQNANDKDKVWTIALFSGRRPKRTISSTQLKLWCAEFCDIPLWLLDESYHTVGDLSETIALLISNTINENTSSPSKPLHYYTQKFISLEKASDEEKRAFMIQSWQELNNIGERFVFNKLLSGIFRAGVSQQLMASALAKVVDKPTTEVLHLLSGNWNASTTTFHDLVFNSGIEADVSRPYPFCLAYPLEQEVSELGEISDWLVEWKWDGIRGQVIKRQGEMFIWSRGEELLTEKFPELHFLKEYLPDGCVIDGELMVAKDGKPMPFSLLQTRIGRKNISKKTMESAPISLFAYDLLEWNGEDIREISLTKRREKLESLVQEINHEKLLISPIVQCNNWAEVQLLRESSRDKLAEGFMLKQATSTYQTGRKRGSWWKWKVEPFTIDAVLLYAQKGSGKRSNLYTDYTFAVKDGDALVPFAKAYSGLTDKEILQVDSFVKRNAVEKFGPVRTVKPELVFELAFEGISASKRHKCGVAVRFPRIKRWRTDKKVEDINTLEDLKGMLSLYGQSSEK